MPKVQWNDPLFERLVLKNPPASTVREPRNDVLELRVAVVGSNEHLFEIQQTTPIQASSCRPAQARRNNVVQVERCEAVTSAPQEQQRVAYLKIM